MEDSEFDRLKSSYINIIKYVVSQSKFKYKIKAVRQILVSYYDYYFLLINYLEKLYNKSIIFENSLWN